VLSVLAGQRWLILLRSGLALLFGVLVLLWPDPIPPGFAALFGLYALPSGIVALIMTFAAGDTPGYGGLLIEGIGGVVVGLMITVYPGMILYFFESNGGGGIERSAPSGPASAPEGQAENDAVRRAFEDSLAGMPAVWRHVMLLHHVDGLAGPAVARAVGRSESDVQHMIGHAYAYLRERLFEARDMARPGPATPG
jgi:hypothetical protein